MAKLDRRVTPANERVAHISLRGQIEAAAFVTGDWARVVRPVADILQAPAGPRDRQTVYGARFLVLERAGGYAFGQSDRDGYCGYIAEADLGTDAVATHWVSAPATHLYAAPDIKSPDVAGLTLGARLNVVAQIDDRFVRTDTCHYALRCHLSSLVDLATDPAGVALNFLGTPYLWGGNSRSGIDCSGLVQTAHLACGIACPGDSDQQQAAMGHDLAADAGLARGDLLFWKGHVALVLDATTLIHATGHDMAVVQEPIGATIARIIAQGGGPVTARKRL